MDGSPHDWFEGRGARCTLIVFIDDATSRLTALRFAPVESTKATMETLREHLAKPGRPVSVYSDKRRDLSIGGRVIKGDILSLR